MVSFRTQKRTIALLLCWFAVSHATSMAQTSAPAYQDGEILVRFNARSPLSRTGSQLPLGAKHVSSIPQINVHRLALPKNVTVKSALAYFRGRPDVSFAEANFFATTADTTPNDAFHHLQWGLHRIKAPSGWDMTTGAMQVMVAIVDTGIDRFHPDLQNRVIGGHDFANNDSDAQDDHGHGTHVAGIAGSSSNNGIGVSGVNWNTQLLPVKVLRTDGNGTYEDIAEGIVYATDRGARVINLSLGGAQPSGTLQAACQFARDRNVTLVASAGNNGTSSPYYPAAYTECISVASSGPSDNRSAFSNYGGWVSVVAPGENILSTWIGGGYVSSNGTSMAAPFVSGLAALLWSTGYYGNPLNADNVRAAIQRTCDPVGDWVAYGRINVAKAMGTHMPSTELQKAAPSAFYSEVIGASVDGEVMVGFGWLPGQSDMSSFRRKDTFLGPQFEWRHGARAQKVSRDGNAIVGVANVNGRLQCFRWKVEPMLFEYLPLQPINGTEFESIVQAVSVSDNGETISGQAILPGGRSRAFVWSAVHGLIDLGTLGGDYSSAADASNDGSVVVGRATLEDGRRRAFRWTLNSGMTDLGTAGENESAALSVSDDGVTVSGVGISGNSSNPIVWRGQTEISVSNLGGNLGYLLSLTPSGDVAVGASKNASDLLRPVYASGTLYELQEITGLFAVREAWTEATSDSGMRFAGIWRDASGTLGIWESRGFRRLRNLGSFGWNHVVRVGVSGNGHLVYGDLEAANYTSTGVFYRSPILKNPK